MFYLQNDTLVHIKQNLDVPGMAPQKTFYNVEKEFGENYLIEVKYLYWS